jgi:hypothetical protein
MGPNKLEKQFKEQLNSREIQPSQMAWSKLDAMLTATGKPKAKFPWLYIAASFVGFLLIGTFYFNQKDNSIEIKNSEVVLENAVAPQINKATETITKPKEEAQKGFVTTVVQKAVIGSDKKPIVTEKSIEVATNSNQNQIAAVSISNQKSITSAPNTSKVEHLVAIAGNSLKMENHVNERASVKVNAANLLSQVDGELELSFREKVINKVNKNYQTVKVAFANRNLE